MASMLRKQALGIIDVCKTALAGRKKDENVPVDNQTIKAAQAILGEARAAHPDDKVLASVSLDPPVSFWTTVQTAMETVVNTLPSEDEEQLANRIAAARKRASQR